MSKEGWNAHTDKNGKEHADYYDKDPRESDHSSVHITFDPETGKGTIKETYRDSDGNKEQTTTDTSCFLTTACMRKQMEKFDDKCYELEVLRWFRDKFVSKNEIDYYYKIAPLIVQELNNIENNNVIYSYIYNNVINRCVKAIENKDYKLAYLIYKNCIISLESELISKTNTSEKDKVLYLK